MMMKMRAAAPKQKGFTLIELMIAVIVLAILTSVAYPSFMDSVRKGNRGDASSALTRAASAQERFFATNGTYTADVTNLGFADGGITEHGHYQLTIAPGPTGIGSSYVLTATAKAGSMQAQDTGCTVLSLNSLGVQLPDPSASLCW